jgi:hypothetical protein
MPVMNQPERRGMMPASMPRWSGSATDEHRVVIDGYDGTRGHFGSFIRACTCKTQRSPHLIRRRVLKLLNGCPGHANQVRTGTRSNAEHSQCTSGNGRMITGQSG